MSPYEHGGTNSGKGNSGEKKAPLFVSTQFSLKFNFYLLQKIYFV